MSIFGYRVTTCDRCHKQFTDYRLSAKMFIIGSLIKKSLQQKFIFCLDYTYQLALFMKGRHIDEIVH